MNYRHLFHAGSLDDVFKHVVQIELIRAMQKKATPFFFLDTHAGRGCYDLHSEEAQKTKKSEEGIVTLMAIHDRSLWAPSLQQYASCIEAFNRDRGCAASPPRFYLGSAVLASLLLRPIDRFAACELHPKECEQLKRHLRGLAHHAVHHRDGLEAMNALLPPVEKRGLIIIDPPYEKVDEVSHIENALKSGLKKYAQGVFALWYPIKSEHLINGFLHRLPQWVAPNTLHQVQYVKWHDDNASTLLGSGVIVINPPWDYINNIQKTINCLNQILNLHELCRVECRLID